MGAGGGVELIISARVLHIVYHQVFYVPQILHFEPSLDALSEQSDFTSSTKILSRVHPGGNPGVNFKSISHRCYLRHVAFVWKLTEEIIDLPQGCLQDGAPSLWTPSVYGLRL